MSTGSAGSSSVKTALIFLLTPLSSPTSCAARFAVLLVPHAFSRLRTPAPSALRLDSARAINWLATATRRSGIYRVAPAFRCVSQRRTAPESPDGDHTGDRYIPSTLRLEGNVGDAPSASCETMNRRIHRRGAESHRVFIISVISMSALAIVGLFAVALIVGVLTGPTVAPYPPSEFSKLAILAPAGIFAFLGLRRFYRAL